MCSLSSFIKTEKIMEDFCVVIYKNALLLNYINPLFSEYYKQKLNALIVILRVINLDSIQE